MIIQRLFVIAAYSVHTLIACFSRRFAFLSVFLAWYFLDIFQNYCLKRPTLIVCVIKRSSAVASNTYSDFFSFIRPRVFLALFLHAVHICPLSVCLILESFPTFLSKKAVICLFITECSWTSNVCRSEPCRRCRESWPTFRHKRRSTAGRSCAQCRARPAASSPNPFCCRPK